MSAARRRVLAAGLSVLALVSTGAVAAGPATANSAGPFCSDNGDTTPCVISASVQTGLSAPVPITSSGDDFDLVFGGSCGVPKDPDGACQGSVAWDFNPGNTALATNQTFTLTADLGTFIPSENDTFGVNATMNRSQVGTRLHPDYHVTISAQPTLQDNGSSCTESGNSFLCAEQATSSSIGLFGVLTDDYANSPASIAGPRYGTDDWSTSSATGPPLFLAGAAAGTITIPIGNTHLHADGSVVHGEYQAFLPNSLLAYIGIDDPTTITSASLSVALESGTVTVTPSADGATIDISDIIWPEPPAGMTARLAGTTKKAHDPPLKIKPGIITPSRAIKVHAHRVSSTAGHFTFSAAKARGSRIKSFHVSCSATHHTTKTGTSTSRKHLKVKHLQPGVSYRCKVRAVAKAGRGRWSAPVKLKH